MNVDEEAAGLGEPSSPSLSTPSLLGRFAHRFSQSPVPFQILLPDGTAQRFGRGPPSFFVTLKSRRAWRAIASADEGSIGDAYVAGEIDIDGDMLRPFELRKSMRDIHPLVVTWRFLQPLLFGQLYTNRQAIAAHYDIAPEFFLSFLDAKVPCYTQGIYTNPAETLEIATLRKFEYCFEKLRLQPGDHIFEIGPGWGAWFEYASRRGIKCTGVTNSQFSVDYLTRRAQLLGYDWEVIKSDFLEYRSDRKYDAIVIMGVIEHLPQYKRVLEKFVSLVKPGRFIFLDASANTKKYELSSFMAKYIYGGNHSFLVLHDFIEKVARTQLDVLEMFNDRSSYFLTFQQWASNLDANRDHVIERYGAFNYRRFRLYLWGAAYEFLSGSLDCYRMILQSPNH